MATTTKDLNLVKSAQFISSNTQLSLLPEPILSEYAFIGRSNVGKSSLINALCSRKGLAKVSNTPGKTQTINHYLIDNTWYLVDLPGYGYAKVPKDLGKDWERFIHEYLEKRSNLLNVFVLIDSRLEPQKNDLLFMNWLGEKQIPFSIIFTKIDKISSSIFNKQKVIYQKKMLETWEEMPPIFSTSSEHLQGLRELYQYILTLNKIDIHL